MSRPLDLRHVKTYRSNGRVYHYSRITKERLPDNPVERAERVRQINESRRPGPGTAVRRSVEYLERRKAALQADVLELKKATADLRERIKSAKGQARHFSLASDAEDALARPDAYWAWAHPQPAPKRLRGVYRLMKNGKTVYIGQSVDIISRVLQHAAEKDFDEFSYALVDGSKETLNAIETALIVLERPPENRTADTKWSRARAEAILSDYRGRANTLERGPHG